MNEDFYSILGVAPTATADEIKERYRYLSHAYHPDKFATKAQRDSAERDFKRINRAYQVLSDPTQRARFDASRSQSAGGPPPASSRTSPPNPAARKAVVKRSLGFIRLGTVLFFLFWGCFSFMEWDDKLKARNDHIFSQLDENFGIFPRVPTGWKTEIAKDEFLSLSPKEREFVAKRYYEEHVEGLAKEGYFDNEALKLWFIRTATLTLQEAPIKERHPFDDDPSYAIRYRNIPFGDMPRMQLWRVLLVKEIYALALGAAVLTTFVAALCFFVIRWIARGFRRIPATS